ncbi:MASE1 domain-containing protein [Dyella acidiphila]|uniref:MASE1 domain-containing protein n=1 Tax=Dyella acidiphila TaxID=2775866 RepID=A0ABR9G642_9GAMM|nr:MASE1 domain-containing protein [Dyella acidiphila]MBE1159527.1 MASE1 domain-containing protein [Dyella acidiphila]
MANVSLQREWPVHIGIAVGYALFYVLIHPFSTSHWPIHAGVRFACLLLFPYRFWPALLLGEGVANFYEVYPCLDSLGRNWVIARSVPPILPIMPIVWWCRERMPPLPSSQYIDIKALLVCILLASIGGMVYSSLAGFVSTPQSGHPAFGVDWVTVFFLGPCLAIFSVAPWVLLASLYYRRGRWREQLAAMLSNRLTFDLAVFFLPCAAVIEWIVVHNEGQTRLLAPMAMFIPLVWLTLRHGWRAAAVGSPVAIAAMTLPVSLEDFIDERMLPTPAMVFLVLAVAGLFALGARISTQLMREAAEQESAANAQRFAKQSLQLGEQRMRQTSMALEYLAGNLHVNNAHLLEQMRRIVPNIESHAFYKQAMATHSQVYRLAESMHPIAWRERGLPAALNETIARALDEAGIAYRCDITGRGFTRMAPSVLSATYRIACEAVVYISSRLACSRIRLTLRGGETHGRRWLVLRVEGVLDPSSSANPAHFAEDRQRLPAKLGASALNVQELRDHVGIFDGVLHTQVSRDRLRMTALLHDAVPEVLKEAAAAAPMRLWVK